MINDVWLLIFSDARFKRNDPDGGTCWPTNSPPFRRPRPLSTPTVARIRRSQYATLCYRLNTGANRESIGHS